jgi:hypothetical protein
MLLLAATDYVYFLQGSWRNRNADNSIDYTSLSKFQHFEYS